MSNQMPGESFWVHETMVRPRSSATLIEPGMDVRVIGGEHEGAEGIVRAVDGNTEMVQVRTGDPSKWREWDAETRRLLEGR